MATTISHLQVLITGNTLGLATSLSNANRDVEGFAANASRTFADVGRNLTRNLTIPIAAAFGGSIKAAVDFEAAFANVRKTVDASEDEFADLETTIRSMATTGLTAFTPGGADQLAEIAAIAGQLGVEIENIPEFTKAIALLSVTADNLDAEAASTNLARFLNVAGGGGFEDVVALASVITELGNNFGTTEAQILTVGTRLAGIFSAIGASEQEILGVAAAISSLTIRDEAAGSGLSRIVEAMASGLVNADALGVDELGRVVTAYSELADMDISQFEELLTSSPGTALLEVATGLAAIEDPLARLEAIVGESGLDIGNIIDETAMLALTNNTDLLSEALTLASNEFDAFIIEGEEASALFEEAGKRSETTASQFQKTLNVVNELAITMGNKLLPAVNDILEIVAELAEEFTNLPESTQSFILQLGLIAAAVGPAAIALSALLKVGSLLSTVGGIVASVTIKSVGAVVPAAATAVATNAVIGAVGAAFAALAPIAVGVTLALSIVKLLGLEDEIEKGVAVIQRNFAFATGDREEFNRLTNEHFPEQIGGQFPLFTEVDGVVTINPVFQVADPLGASDPVELLLDSMGAEVSNEERAFILENFVPLIEMEVPIIPVFRFAEGATPEEVFKDNPRRQDILELFEAGIFDPKVYFGLDEPIEMDIDSVELSITPARINMSLDISNIDPAVVSPDGTYTAGEGFDEAFGFGTTGSGGAIGPGAGVLDIRTAALLDLILNPNQVQSNIDKGISDGEPYKSDPETETDPILIIDAGAVQGQIDEFFDSHTFSASAQVHVAIDPSLTLGGVPVGGGQFILPSGESVPSFASGGLFQAPHGRASGLALLHDGEVVLNESQQRNLRGKIGATTINHFHIQGGFVGTPAQMIERMSKLSRDRGI